MEPAGSVVVRVIDCVRQRIRRIARRPGPVQGVRGDCRLTWPRLRVAQSRRRVLSAVQAGLVLAAGVLLRQAVVLLGARAIGKGSQVVLRQRIRMMLPSPLVQLKSIGVLLLLSLVLLLLEEVLLWLMVLLLLEEVLLRLMVLL